MSVDYMRDVRPRETESRLGVGAVTDGTVDVDLSADSPDLSGVAAGDVFWIDFLVLDENDRRFGVVVSADDVAKTVRVDVLFAPGSGKAWGVVRDSLIGEPLSHRTFQDMPLIETKRHLREANLWEKNPITRARDIGKIGQAMIDPALPAELFAGLTSLAGALYEESTEAIHTNSNLVTAKRISSAITALIALGHVTVADGDGFFALGGGKHYPGDPATAAANATADVKAGRAAWVASEAARRDRASRLAAANAIKTRADAAIEAANAEYRREGSTPASVTAAGEAAFWSE